MRASNRILLLVLLILCAVACSKKQEGDDHSPEHSLADLKVYDGLEVSLFASEPMFSNPTNIAVDARGRVWVCEAYNYRNQLNPKNPVKAEGDRIMILEDTDGDGKADKSKVFYQGTDVNSALGICVLGNRVFVSCSPNVFVFTDENGDDVPDKKETWFTGIQGEQHDHGMHAFTFGHDGRLYFNMGNEARLLLSAKGDTIRDIHGRNVFTNGKPFRQGLALRSKTDGTDVEVIGYNFRNNYELTVDPYGTVWQSDNDDDGNKGTRINYVMEQGNFGYTDELTGAGWSARRTNIEKEIPLRHWHLNDPGSVPNVLQTGSGSPSGITLYEGTLLPEIFHGELIHAEPGHNVVRSYKVENDGAGYQATIVNILEGQQDQWFRPVDVTSAPDGSLIIADWYDPGVGGHQVGDLDRGRIYRVSTPKSKYNVPAIDLSSPDGAVSALINPNTDIRYQAWTALHTMGAKAEAALQTLWKSADPRHQAQALWLLADLPNGRDYIAAAASDKQANLRIASLRVARQLNKEMMATAALLVNDPSPQVRREVALTLRGVATPQAADLWAQLALQHDGKDRWYLEALGIAAQGNEDAFFSAWKKRVGDKWNTPAGHDIIWRSRSREALPLLAAIIKTTDEKDMLRYFRAFDFHTEGAKQKVLEGLVTQTKGDKVFYALKHMNTSGLAMTPAVKASLQNVLKQKEGTLEFVELVSSFKLQDRSNELLSLAIHYPDSAMGKEAAKALLEWNRPDLFEAVLQKKDREESLALVKALRSQMRNQKVMAFMEKLMLDSANDIEVRKLAVKSFGGPWESEDRLITLAREEKIPADLEVTAAGVFQTAWRSNIREDGAKYLKLPPNKDGKTLPAISVLLDKKGSAEKGKAVFSTVCSTCHQINKAGVNFGPDLSEIGGKLPKEALYTAILYPDQGISFGFEGYHFKLKDGSSAFGRIVSETEDKIDLQYMTTEQTISKSDIVSRVKLESSLMPSNLQSLMSEDEIVDLVEYLSELKK